MHGAAPFDALAADYDSSFSSTSIGTLMRAAVWRRLEAHFRPGGRVLELNCGTGNDAVYLARRGVQVLATDASQAMLSLTRVKAERAGVAHLVQTAVLPIEDLSEFRPDTKFQGALSNFGGLNCVADLASVSRHLAPLLRPGGMVLLCIMGPVVPWEWGWYLARGQPRKALRRLRRGGVVWRGTTIRYPAAGRVRRFFSSHFVQRRLAAIGALTPPPYCEDWAVRHPRLLAVLDRWERRLETIPPLPLLADHYLLELERTDRLSPVEEGSSR